MKKILAFTLFSMLGIQSAMACSVASPVYVFVYQNDSNGDGALDKDEWKNAKLDNNLTTSVKLKKWRTLLKLDTNKNGTFDSLDSTWNSTFAYKQNPCDNWENYSRQISSQYEQGIDDPAIFEDQEKKK